MLQEQVASLQSSLTQLQLLAQNSQLLALQRNVDNLMRSNAKRTEGVQFHTAAPAEPKMSTSDDDSETFIITRNNLGANRSPEEVLC